MLRVETKLEIRKRQNMACKLGAFLLLVNVNRAVCVVNNGLIICNDYRKHVNVHFFYSYNRE